VTARRAAPSVLKRVEEPGERIGIGRVDRGDAIGAEFARRLLEASNGSGR
jgi:hypothetical protein